MKNLKVSEKHVQHGLSQFELTNYLLQNLNKYDLSPAGKLVLLHLSTYYNPQKADMFPKQKTIALKLGISERSVVRAVQELIKGGLILVECKYTNHYVFGAKIGGKLPENENFFESEKLSDDFGKIGGSKRDKMSHHDINKQNEQNNEPTGGKDKTFSLDDYKILKDYAVKHNAKNVSAYVNWLIREGKAGEIIGVEKRKAKRKVQRIFEKQQQTQEWEAHKAECAKPIKEQYTYETAYALIQRLAGIDKNLLQKGIAKKLASTFNIKI